LYEITQVSNYFVNYDYYFLSFLQSSGSGSESGTQTQKSVKSRSLEKFDNNSGSNDEQDNGSLGLNNGDGSDNGSGTQVKLLYSVIFCWKISCMDYVRKNLNRLTVYCILSFHHDHWVTVCLYLLHFPFYVIHTSFVLFKYTE